MRRNSRQIVAAAQHGRRLRWMCAAIALASAAVLVTVLFYGTPLLYPIEVVPETLRQIIMMNPLASVFELGRVWVIDPEAPGPADAAGGFALLLVPIAIYIGICVLSVWVFNREAPRIAEQL